MNSKLLNWPCGYFAPVKCFFWFSISRMSKMCSSISAGDPSRFSNDSEPYIKFARKVLKSPQSVKMAGSCLDSPI